MTSSDVTTLLIYICTGMSGKDFQSDLAWNKGYESHSHLAKPSHFLKYFQPPEMCEEPSSDYNVKGLSSKATSAQMEERKPSLAEIQKKTIEVSRLQALFELHCFWWWFLRGATIWDFKCSSHLVYAGRYFRAWGKTEHDWWEVQRYKPYRYQQWVLSRRSTTGSSRDCCKVEVIASGVQ